MCPGNPGSRTHECFVRLAFSRQDPNRILQELYLLSHRTFVHDRILQEIPSTQDSMYRHGKHIAPAVANEHVELCPKHTPVGSLWPATSRP